MLPHTSSNVEKKVPQKTTILTFMPEFGFKNITFRDCL